MSDTAGPRSDGFVDQLLLEAGLDDDGGLRPALLQLRALGAVAPEPSAEIAALLKRAEAAPAVTTEAAYVPAAQPAPAADAAATSEVAAPSAAVPLDELAARRRAKRRVSLTALSLAVSLSAGGAVAAASDQGFRDSFNQFNQAVTSFVTGSGPVPAVHQSEEPAPNVPAVPAAPSTVPAAPAPAAPVEAPPSNMPAQPEEAAEEPATPGKPADVPAAKDRPTAAPEHLTNGVGQPPQVPVPGVSELPLPGTLPAVPLP